MNIEMLEEKAQEILDIESITNQNIILLDKIIEELSQKLDLCIGFPLVSVFFTIHKVGKSYFDYKMMVRMLKFYTECKNIDKAKRDKFCKKNVYGKEKKIGYSILQLLERLDIDEKAKLIGKLYVYCVENEYDVNSYFRICRIVEKCYFDDLEFLNYWKENKTICSKNKLIPQEIVEALYSVGLLAECGYDGGGFKEDDDEGIKYSLNKYGEILLNIIG